MLKNTWCWSDFYAKFLWSCDLRTYKEGITEIFCFESIWPISKQFVEIDCSLLLNIKPKRSTWTAVVFLGQVTLYSDYLLQPPPALYYLTNSVLQSVFLPTVLVDHGKKLGQKASFWLDKTHLLSSWVETMFCFGSTHWNEMFPFGSTRTFHFLSNCGNKIFWHLLMSEFEGEGVNFSVLTGESPLPHNSRCSYTGLLRRGGIQVMKK